MRKYYLVAKDGKEIKWERLLHEVELDFPLPLPSGIALKDLEKGLKPEPVMVYFKAIIKDKRHYALKLEKGYWIKTFEAQKKEREKR